MALWFYVPFKCRGTEVLSIEPHLLMFLVSHIQIFGTGSTVLDRFDNFSVANSPPWIRFVVNLQRIVYSTEFSVGVSIILSTNLNSILSLSFSKTKHSRLSSCLCGYWPSFFPARLGPDSKVAGLRMSTSSWRVSLSHLRVLTSRMSTRHFLSFLFIPPEVGAQLEGGGDLVGFVRRQRPRASYRRWWRPRSRGC